MRKLVIIVILVALFLLALFLLVSPRQNTPYERSALGNKGLDILLNANDIDAFSSDKYKKYSLDQFDFRLLSMDAILFSYLDRDFEVSSYRNGVKLNNLVQDKVEEMTTVIVLPKWKKDLNKKLLADNSALLPLKSMNWIVASLNFDQIKIERSLDGFTHETVKGELVSNQQIELFDAQFFRRDTIPDECEELMGIKAGALLLACYSDYFAYFLSDPDLLNNHGLSLGKNASFAVEFVDNLMETSDTTVAYLDSSEKLFETQYGRGGSGQRGDGQSTPPYERNFQDFARLFEYPLSIIWAAILMITIICLWRGAFRFGPPLKDVNGNIEISKTAAVNAMARLLRLSGNDGHMVAQFVQNSLIDRAVLAFGESGGNQAGVDRLMQRLAQKDKSLAEQFEALTKTLTQLGPIMGRQELRKNLEEFRELLRRVDLESR